MIEHKLEELIKRKKDLGYEFNPDEIKTNVPYAAKAYKRTLNYFMNNKEFMMYCNSNEIALCSDIEDMVKLSMVYAYYYGLDYVQRKEATVEFGFDYIRNAIWLEHENDAEVEVRKVYNRGRIQIKRLCEAASVLKDPMHENPYFKKGDLLKSDSKDFLGNIPRYIQKIIKKSENGKDYLFDLLPSLTLAIIRAVTYIPQGRNVKNGYYTIKEVKELSIILAEETKKKQVNIPCEYAELLYSLAQEDLLYMNRLSNTIDLYIKCVDKFDLVNMSESIEEELLRNIFSVYFRLPSVYFQERCTDLVNNICEGIQQNNHEAIIKNMSSILCVGNIAFQQVLIVTLCALFLDKEDNIKSCDKVKEMINSIETFITSNRNDIDKHFNCGHLGCFWENGKNIYEYKKNIGPGRKIVTEYELIDNKSKFKFYEMTEMLLSPEPRWRYTSLLEDNNGKRTFLEGQGRSWPNKGVKLSGSENIMIYTSEEYQDILLYFFLREMDMYDRDISKRVSSYDYCRGATRLLGWERKDDAK